MKIEELRAFLTDRIRMETDFSQTDQNKGFSPPPIEKPIPQGAKTYQLPAWETAIQFETKDLIDLIAKRKSVRLFSSQSMTLEELSFLLWATQGIRERGPYAVLRHVPSAGNRHSFETYLCIRDVASLPQGIYRYLPLSHTLVFLYKPDNLEKALNLATLGQSFVGKAPLTFVWSTIPYRMEWRYGKASHKVIAMDAGHLCQNLYLAAGAIGCGTCAIGAYHQDYMDELIQVDGKDEFVVYLAPVGQLR